MIRTSGALGATERAQAEASDPAVSAWVGANAGAGKTHVLKLRVLRLLLSGTPPERLLCLTYTKAAAAEMAQRVFADLARWTTAADGELGLLLSRLLARTPTRQEQLSARSLFARALETPGGLKVQTIHAFCERLLQRFPLEAGVPPGFSILDEVEQRDLLRQATDAVLGAAMRERSELARAVEKVVAFAAADGFDGVLGEALAKREWVERFSRLALRGGSAAAQAERFYREALALAHPDAGAIEHALATLLPESAMARAAAALATGSTSDGELSAALAAAREAPSERARVEALRKVFLTTAGAPRARMVTNAIRAAHPEVDRLLAQAQREFLRLLEARMGHQLVEASIALLQLADAVLLHYAHAKARRAALDFDDLIAKAAGLLDGPAATQWVLYKLDGGLDHVLVDEAQDTSPAQWRLVQALANEFFSGAGAREQVRTLFAVGDEKQSIYGFQGAAPKMFAGVGREFAARARAARQAWRDVPLTLSFRSTVPVLATVDGVFADADRTPGLGAAAAPLRHEALRIGQAGLVEMWPTEQWEQVEPAEPWSPLSDVAPASPVVRLAERIAGTIAHWLEAGEVLHSEGRPVRAGDVLVLVRKRQPFAPVMVKALKGRGIPVAGSDRMMLSRQLAVLDLVALADFVVLPEDDLALATVLKSPLVGLSDDDLMAFAPRRKGSLWRAFLAAAETTPRFAAAAQTLKQWRALAGFAPPFEFFARVLDRDGMRRRLLERLGPDAADPLDEFLGLAMAYDERTPPSLTGFVHWLRRSNHEIKRDLDHGRDEVRVMTVHGAKGLEAPIVFLPDTCSAASGRGPAGLLALTSPVPAGVFPEPWVWPVKGTSGHPEVKAARARQTDAEAEERNRLLYVAMTRARDRLYIAGWEGKSGRSESCWYDQITAGLAHRCQPATAVDGGPVLRLSTPQAAAPDGKRERASASVAPAALPPWALAPPPREPMAAIPLAPSRATPLAADAAGEPAEPRREMPPRDRGLPSPLDLGADYRFLRGTITHALLEHLPTVSRSLRPGAAERFVAVRGRRLPATVRAGIVAEVLAILENGEFAALFGPGSRAEVPIAGMLPHPAGRGPVLQITGQIDRLVALDREILILDYKTNRPPPARPDEVPAAYVEQLAAYRLVLRGVFPDRPIRAAILWTDGPRLMPLPSTLLDRHQDGLWERAAGSP